MIKKKEEKSRFLKLQVHMKILSVLSIGIVFYGENHPYNVQVMPK